MNRIIADANVLVRLVDVKSPQHSVVREALERLHSFQALLCTVPQAFFEFWVVATRPTPNNGLGLSIEECDQDMTRLENVFEVLDDTRDLLKAWRGLVKANRCIGKVAHDARYVAAMQSLGIKTLLTFNTADFTRHSGIVAIDPHTVLGMGPLDFALLCS
jgi:predicted nucleic acid-binding protein